MTGEYVKTRVTEHGTQYSPACHYCPFEGTWFEDGARVNAGFHEFAHMNEGVLW